MVGRLIRSSRSSLAMVRLDLRLSLPPSDSRSVSFLSLTFTVLSLVSVGIHRPTLVAGEFAVSIPVRRQGPALGDGGLADALEESDAAEAVGATCDEVAFIVAEFVRLHWWSPDCHVGKVPGILVASREPSLTACCSSYRKQK